MWLKFCVDLDKILEVIRLLVMTVFFVSPCINTNILLWKKLYNILDDLT